MITTYSFKRSRREDLEDISSGEILDLEISGEKKAAMEGSLCSGTLARRMSYRCQMAKNSRVG